MKANTVSNSSQAAIGPLQIGIGLLGLATALIHISLLFPDPLFILNGLGYLALLAAYFLPVTWLRENHGLIRWIFIGYTLVTIIAWVIMGDKSWPGGAIGYVTKAIEVVLLILLFIDSRR
jgi:hypothetical protein